MHQPAWCIGSPSNKVMFSQVTNFRMQNRNVQMFPDFLLYLYTTVLVLGFSFIDFYFL